MIVKGSNGVELVVNLWEKSRPYNLAGATVEIALRTGARVVVKTATIVRDGIVSVTLTSEDIATAGNYFIQARVNNLDGASFTSEMGSFTIDESIFP